MYYYIYHIKGVKVGCTTDLKKRVELVQGFKDYEVLYKTRDILNASIAELYYQNIFKYKLDKNSYLKLTQKKMLHITERTITFRNTNDSKFIGYKFPQIIELLDGTHIELNDQTIEWILNNNSESHRNKERFVYIQALLNYVNSSKTNELDIFKNIREWASNKGIFEKGDVKTQYIKLQEEAGELAKALLTNDKEEIIDAIGDCVVVLTNLSKLAGYNIEDCILSAYNVISKRTGKMENGTFKKD
jgi:NTP pyrophosphatase (non-canonical NTP hydrolase)